MTAPTALLAFEQAGGKPFNVDAADAALAAKRGAPAPQGPAVMQAQVPSGDAQPGNQPASALQNVGVDYVPPAAPAVPDGGQRPVAPAAMPVPATPGAPPSALNTVAGIETPSAPQVATPAQQPGQPPATSPASPGDPAALPPAAGADPGQGPGQAHVGALSGAIQKYTEEGVATLYETAKLNPDVISQIAEGGTPVEKSLAAKVLEQHADEFGAATLDEYTALNEVNAAEGDPARQEAIRLEQGQKAINKRLDDREWTDFVRDNKIPDDVAKVASGLKDVYPGVPHGRLVHMARGEMGIEAPPSTTKDLTAAPAGNIGGGSQQDGSSEANPAVAHALGISAEDTRNAGEYFDQIGVPR
tara:strand:+ start:4217 stop:5293 length:1077 start_codon:yes stop_codon:yes gene_type:complete